MPDTGVRLRKKHIAISWPQEENRPLPERNSPVPDDGSPAAEEEPPIPEREALLIGDEPSPGNPPSPEGDLPSLREDDRKVYSWIARRAQAGVEEIAVGVGMPRRAVEVSLGRLAALRLVRTGPAPRDHYAAVAPATAGIELLGPLLRDIGRRQRAADHARAALDELTDLYQDSLTSASGCPAVDVVESPARAARLVGELAVRCRTEIIVSQPDPAAAVAAVTRYRSIGDDLLRRGVRIRGLLPHSARFRPPLVAHLRTYTQQGASYRTCGDNFVPLALFDGQIAVFPHHADAGGLVLAREPGIVRFAAATFECAWARGSQFTASYDRDVVEELSECTKRAIMQLMIQGIEDRVIAHRLNMSLRSCQRHIQAIMLRLGAKTRMHAGFLISEHGLLVDRAPATDLPAH
jgi:DNA-binding CsgD family transcriptional regulator